MEKKCLDRNYVSEADTYVLTCINRLPKAFDCLLHSLAIAKLHGHGTNKTSTEYLKNYLYPENCPCKSCKTYIQYVGFLWEYVSLALISLANSVILVIQAWIGVVPLYVESTCSLIWHIRILTFDLTSELQPEH